MKITTDQHFSKEEIAAVRKEVLKRFFPQLKDIASIIVAGLDGRDDLIPKRHVKACGLERAREIVRHAALMPTCDLIQNSVSSASPRYWGGRDEDGTFGFGLYGEDNDTGVGYEINLTPNDARTIVAGKPVNTVFEFLNNCHGRACCHA